MKKLIGFAFVAFISACGGAPVDENTSTDPNVGETEQAVKQLMRCQVVGGVLTGKCYAYPSPACGLFNSAQCPVGQASTSSLSACGYVNTTISCHQ